LDYIAQFTNKFDYVQSECNVADAVSRPIEDASALVNILSPSQELDYLIIALAQHDDSEIERLRVNNDTSLHPVEVLLADHGVHLLCDDSRGNFRPIIPHSLRFSVFKQYHCWSHPGTKTGIRLIGDRFMWPFVRKDIAR